MAPSDSTGLRVVARRDGTLVLQFVVDTSGRADTTTVRDVWPADRPRLTSDPGEYYAAFMRTATEALRRARFYPAGIAGCRVRQLVQLPFTYTLLR